MQSTDVRFEQGVFQAVDGPTRIFLCNRRNAIDIEGRLVVSFCLGPLSLRPQARLKSTLYFKVPKESVPDQYCSTLALFYIWLSRSRYVRSRI